jgi:hypothetical protein
VLIPGNLAPLELLQYSPAEITQTDKGYITVQQWVLTSFDSGKMTLPALPTAGGLTSKPDTIVVTQMPADSLKGYAEPKTYFPKSTPDQWPYRMGLLAITIISGYLLWRIVGRGKALREKHKLDKLSKPAQWQKEMKQLQAHWQEEKIKAMPAATKLMLLIRALLQQSGIDTSSLTGRESIARARNYFEVNQHHALLQSVDHCYSILYGKYQPEKQELLQAMQDTNTAAQSFFEQAKRHTAS